MVWKVELAKSAVAELDKLDPQVARRILLFLHQRVANLDNPRSIGEALKGARLGSFWKYSRIAPLLCRCCMLGIGERFIGIDLNLKFIGGNAD